MASTQPTSTMPCTTRSSSKRSVKIPFPTSASAPERSANLLELVVLDRRDRPSRDPRDAHSPPVPATATTTREATLVAKPATAGTRRGKPTPQPGDLVTYGAEAERDYNVDEVMRRRSGRLAIGSSVASVESVRLEPELKRDLLLRAAEDNTSVSDVIRLIGAYLQTG